MKINVGTAASPFVAGRKNNDKNSRQAVAGARFVGVRRINRACVDQWSTPVIAV